MLATVSGNRAICLLLAGGLFLLAIYNAIMSRWSRRWPKTTGIVKVSFVEKDDEGESHVFAYAYTVDGCEYVSAVIRFGGNPFNSDWRSPDAPRQCALRYPERKRVEVYYCPTKPQRACLEPGGLSRALPLFAGAAAIFVVAWFV